MERGEAVAQSMSKALEEAASLVNQTMTTARQMIQVPRKPWSLFSTSLVSGECASCFRSGFELIDSPPLFVWTKQGCTINDHRVRIERRRLVHLGSATSYAHRWWLASMSSPPESRSGLMLE